MTTLIHPGFLRMLDRSDEVFFPLRSNVEEKAGTLTLDDYGQEVETWTPVSGWMDIPSTKSPLSAMEMQATKYTSTDRVWHVLLKGSYPDITTRHHLRLGEEVYDIDSVEVDQTKTVTRLLVSQISI